MYGRLILWLSIPFLTLYAQCIPLFHPPDGWEYALPEHHSPFIQAGFVGKGFTAFRPSINLATEEIDVSAKQYCKAVKEIHLSDTAAACLDLGKFKTKAGDGRLFEITTTSPAGEVKMAQMILVQKNIAYILTGAALKEEYLRFHPIFMKAFQSFALVSDLLSLLPSEKKRRFEEWFSDLQISNRTDDSKRAELQKKVSEEGSQMGSHWQLLVLKEGWEKLNRM